ncbi:MAG TPA: hypothetical protein VFC37_23490 [Terracidiphilus sp.]|jgi:hypothetical protein|nr:hypothetical protein [Terracidiphilus sp.]
MNGKPAPTSTTSPDLPNGSGAAAILAAGIGSMMVAIFAIAADKSAAIKSMMIFYKPTGPLSGVTTSAILVWLISWAILDLLWRKRAVSLGRISTAALVLLVLSLLLTFPPIADLL